MRPLASMDRLQRTAIVPAMTLLLAIAAAPAGCSRKPAAPAHSDAGSPEPGSSGSATPPAADATPMLVKWANGEPVALVRTREGVVARAITSGRSVLLWTGAATFVVHDAELDLVWAQASAVLDVIDLRATDQKMVRAIATGLPAVPIAILRTTADGTHASTSPSGCDSGKALGLEWTEQPHLKFMDSPSAGWVMPQGAKLVGANWLRKNLSRPRQAGRVARVDFPSAAGAPPSPFSALPKCAADFCGRAIPFDGSGAQLVVTSFERGDCEHLGCHVYNPETKQLATPPAADAWDELAKVPSGSCGTYRFDGSGKRFLAGTQLCSVRARCEDLGGTGVGWLAGGRDVGRGD